MSIVEVDNIKKIFSELQLHPAYLEHEPVLTSEQAANTRGFELKQGIKSILFTNGSGEYAVADVPADKKVNQKALAEAVGWSKSVVRMATPSEVLEITGCEIVSVPPFGHKKQIPIFVDFGVYDNEESDFNIGLLTHSVKIKTEEMKTVFSHFKAKEGRFVK